MNSKNSISNSYYTYPTLLQNRCLVHPTPSLRRTMAKSIRSKVKKRNRSILRRTVGKEFNDKVLAKTEAIRLKNLAARHCARRSLRCAPEHCRNLLARARATHREN